MAHTFTPSTQAAEAGVSVNSRIARASQRDPASKNQNLFGCCFNRGLPIGFWCKCFFKLAKQRIEAQ